MLLAMLALVGAMISIQFGAALAKHLFPIIGPEGTTAFRLFVAASILAVVWRPWRKKLTRTDLLLIVPYGLTLGTMNVLFYKAIERIPLGIAIALEFSGPLAVAVFASRKRSDLIWVGIAIIGIALILPLSEFSQPLDPIGIFFAFAAGACWAGYIVFGQRAAQRIPAGLATSAGMIVAAFVAVPIGVAVAGIKLLNINVLPLALGVGVFSSAIPYSLEMTALKKISTGKFGTLMSLEPAVGALAGWILLGELLTGVQWTAIGLIVIASIGTARS
jgi:inner membrane transporter RhtA